MEKEKENEMNELNEKGSIWNEGGLFTIILEGSLLMLDDASVS